jgi:hypothetical protein
MRCNKALRCSGEAVFSGEREGQLRGERRFGAFCVHGTDWDSERSFLVGSYLLGKDSNDDIHVSRLK